MNTLALSAAQLTVALIIVATLGLLVLLVVDSLRKVFGDAFKTINLSQSRNYDDAFFNKITEYRNGIR